MRASEKFQARPPERSPSRIGVLILVGVLLALPVGFGSRALAGSLASDAAATRAMTTAGGYEEARYAATLLAPITVETGPAEDASRLLATKRTRAALRKIEVGDQPGDRSLRNGILRSLNKYSRVTTQLVAARQRGEHVRARALSRSRTLLATSIANRLWRAAEQHRNLALESLRSSRRSDGLALLSVLSLLAFAPFMLLRSASRRRNERERAEQERQRLQRQALTDNLTGLHNHRAFQEEFGRALEQRNRAGGALSVMMIDLDGLKQINDVAGHQAGDELIRSLAECLRETMRTSDMAYRVGGDEFIVILPGERAWGAFEFAQRLRARTITKGVGLAIGITETIAYELKDAVIRRSDLALIDAKRSNRNTVIYSEDLEPGRPPASGNGADDRFSKILATALARAVDAKDRNTRNHCETVSELCVRIGGELGLSNERLGKLRLAGLLHDVGKIGIADAILQKPGPLDLAEMDIMRTHTQIGRDIMTAAELREEADFVLHHHERIDGSGYPAGLAGDAIPLESRIILVADTFEAITSTRPYRESRAQAEALRELEQHAGSQFDPVCVAALHRALGYAPAELTQPAGATVTPLRGVAAA